MANPRSQWPDGTPLRVILRPQSDADSALLAAAYPNMAAAIEQLRQRPEIPVAITDQANSLAAEATRGSLTGLTLTQFLTERSRLHFLAIDGVEPTLENFERGAYPYGKDFRLVFSTRSNPARDRFIAFLQSPEGDRLLRETGNLPVRR
jgi:phosphate transport system substrate-binding protein